jgi:hypothetical protein
MSQIDLTALTCVMIYNDVGGNFYVLRPVYVLFDQLSCRQTREGWGGHYLLAICEQNAIPARNRQSVRL